MEFGIQSNRPKAAISVCVSVAVKSGSLPTRPIVESFIRSCDLCFHFVVTLCVKMGKLKIADSYGASCHVHFAMENLYFSLFKCRVKYVCVFALISFVFLKYGPKFGI